MNSTSPMRTFDPCLVAYYEKESWVAYYRRRWLSLLRLLIALVRSTFGLSLWQSIYVGYLLTRAQVAFAPRDNDVPRAVDYMRRAFAFIKDVHHESFDPDQAAQFEVNWWVVHRQLFGQAENEALMAAVVKVYVAEYNVDPEAVRQAACHRAQAMAYSDRWVQEGLAENSPLLTQEEDELVQSYTLLRRAVQATG